MSKPVKIVITGDLMLGEWHFTQGFGLNRASKRLGMDYFLGMISDFFGGSEVVLSNLEGPVVPYDKAIRNPLLVDENFLPVLRNAGINVLSLANNHLMEQGAGGAQHTIEKIKSEGISLAGWVENPFPRIIVGERSIEILSADVLPIHHRRPAYKDEPMMLSGTIEEIGEIICRQLSQSEADFRIVYLHWGEEYIPVPCPTQVEWGHRFVESGADVVAGTHPHVPQTVEEYKGRLIAYSLGNLVSDMPYPPTREGFLLELQVNPDNTYDYRLIPYRIDDTFRPVPMGEGDCQEFFERLNDNSRFSYSRARFSEEMEQYTQSAVQAENAMWDWVKKFYRRNIFRYPLYVQWGLLKEKLGL